IARQGWAAGEAAGAVALAVGKLYAAPWVPLYILRRRWRAAAWGAVLSAAVFSATLPAIGWRSYETFFLRVAPAMFRGGGFEGWNTGFLTPALAKILPAGLVWKACDWGLILSLLAVYGAAWRRPPLPSGGEEDAAFLRFCAAALAAFVVFRPLSWGYTYTAILPFVPATAEALWRRAKVLFAAYAAGWLWLFLPLSLVLPAGANVFPRAVALLAVLGGFLAAAVLPERAADRPAGPVSA
ncbi:MAG: hypothetical protein IJS32_04190, partial [Kiritimatiellae bacterium]|nr:hypothetical protein [Kiritimatiellia bacterium]